MINAAVADELTARSRHATAHVADVARRDEVFALADSVREQHGRVDVLGNAAYDARVGRFEDLDPADARHDWPTGFASMLWCTQAFHPLLSAAGGSIINVGAATGLKPDTTTFSRRTVYVSSGCGGNAVVGDHTMVLSP